MRICFDMDGTIADLYGVKNWLDYLVKENDYPYRKAKAMINMDTFASYLNRLQKQGYQIGIISWLSKNSRKEYDTIVTNAKKAWLTKHLKTVQFDFIEIIPYGQAKENYCFSKEDILFDDEENNRQNWAGVALDEKNILEFLKIMLDN